MILGERVKILREKRGYSQRELADFLGYGLATVQRVEKNENDPSSDFVGKIAEFFGVTTDYLYGLSDDPNKVYSSELTEPEKAALSAWRRGDKLEAIRLIAERV